MKHAERPAILTQRLATLSEVVRLRILRLLEAEELSVGEVASVVQLPQSTVSRHLKLLSDAGWLVRRSEGTATLYRLVHDELTPGARSLWLAVREQFASSPDVAEDTRRLKAVLNERRADSQAFFGRVAGRWDDVRTELFGGVFTADALLGLLPSHWTVADLGCGTGNAAEHLAAVVERVIAVDQSAPMLQAARKRLARFRNVTFVRAGLEHLPLEAASIDAAVCVLVLHHLEDPAAVLREIRRVLRPGGVALIIDMIEHDRASYRHTMGHRWLGFSEQRLIELMGEAGFVRPRVRALSAEPDARGPGLFACSAQAGEGTGQHLR